MPHSAAFDSKRSELVDRLAGLALANGFEDFGLRDLGAALGTSDRMLLYYFTNKSELVLEVLRRISTRLGAALAVSSGGPPLAPDRFLAQALAQIADPTIGPYVQVWAEVVARGARGEAPFRQAADAAIGDWIAWIGSRLDMPEGPRKTSFAAALLALVEGSILLEMARPGSTEGVSGLLGEVFSGVPL